jgi:Protein of unknown function (DUF1499)
MRRIPAEPLTRQAPASRWLGVGGVVLAVLSLVAVRLGGVDPVNGLAVLAAASVSAGFAVLCALGALSVIWRFGGPGTPLAVRGLLLGAAVLAPLAWFGAMAVRLPLLNDVTTDLAEPPSFGRSRAAVDSRQGRIPAEYSGQFAQDQQESYPAIRTILLDNTPDESLALALRAATNLGWRIVDSSPPSGRTGAGRIEATARSLLFGFTDDITVRIRPAVNETRIDLRSASRVGRHDLGGNARRIAAFQQEIETLAAQR